MGEAAGLSLFGIIFLCNYEITKKNSYTAFHSHLLPIEKLLLNSLLEEVKQFAFLQFVIGILKSQASRFLSLSIERNY